MRFLTQPPPDALSAVVRELWFLDDDGALSAGLPKPHVELVVSLEGLHLWRATPDGPEHDYAQGWVTPLQQAPRYARSVGARRLMGARLEPRLATALFGPLPPGDGRPPPHLSALIGEDADRLRSTLMSAPDIDAVFDRFGAWLEAHITSRAAAIALCDRTLSQRSTRRLYAREVGVSPKRWQLLHRLDRVLRDPELTTAERSLAHLANDHGFADQPHFTREMLRLTGATPTRLRRRSHGTPPHLVRQE